MKMHFLFTNPIFAFIIYYFIFSISKEALAVTDDEQEAFLTFVNGKNGTNRAHKFFAFCQDLENNNKMKNINSKNKIKSIKSLSKFGNEMNLDKKEKHLAQKYAANLGIMYQMRSKFEQCAKGKKEQIESEECEKMLKYFNFLFAFLFRVYAEDALPKEVPQFQIKKENATIFDAVKILNKIAASYFGVKMDKNFVPLHDLISMLGTPTLLDEPKWLNIAGQFSLGQNSAGQKKASVTPNSSQSAEALSDKKQKSKSQAKGTNKEEFNEKLKEMWESVKKEAMEQRKIFNGEVAKYEKLAKSKKLENIFKSEKMKSKLKMKYAELDDKFGIFYIDEKSPLSKVIDLV